MNPLSYWYILENISERTKNGIRRFKARPLDGEGCGVLVFFAGAGT